MTIKRRSLLLGAGLGVAAPALLSLPARAGTLEDTKKRGTFRVGVTQAPPWFSKDPKTGQWSSGLGISMGKAMADKLGVKMETVEVSWGNSIAALQADKIDIMFTIDATPERRQAVDFPEAPLLYYSLALLARDDLDAKTWDGLNKPGVRIAVPQASSMDRFVSEHAPKADIQRFPDNAAAIAAFQSGRVDAVCLFRRCWPPASGWARASWWCRCRPSSRSRARRCARTIPRSPSGSARSSTSTTRAARRRNGTRQRCRISASIPSWRRRS